MVVREGGGTPKPGVEENASCLGKISNRKSREKGENGQSFYTPVYPLPNTFFTSKVSKN